MPSYTQRIERLEAIVRTIQAGVDVDDLVALYDEGKRLHSECTQQLDEAEARIRDDNLSAGESD